MIKNQPSSCGCDCAKTSTQQKPDGATRGAREDYPAKLTPDEDNKSETPNGQRERIR